MSKAAAAVLAACAAAAGYFTLRAGAHNPSWVLKGLFLAWVLSPFVGLMAAGALANRWDARARQRLNRVAFAVALGSVAVYAAFALAPPLAKPASIFLAVPLAAWVLIAIAGAVGRRRARN